LTPTFPPTDEGINGFASLQEWLAMQCPVNATSSIAVPRCNPFTKKYLLSKVRRGAGELEDTKRETDEAVEVMPDEKLPALSLKAILVCVWDCASRSICRNGTDEPCAGQFNPEATIDTANKIPGTFFMQPSGHREKTAEGFIGRSER
jgi:hypothetical protein